MTVRLLATALLAAHLALPAPARQQPWTPPTRPHHPDTPYQSPTLHRTRRTDDVVPTVEIPGELYFTGDPHFGAINILGLTLVGSTGTIPARYDQRLYQLADTFTWNHGDHLWKAGFDWQRYRFGGTSYSRYGGEFRFGDLREFLTLRRSATAQAGSTVTGFTANGIGVTGSLGGGYFSVMTPNGDVFVRVMTTDGTGGQLLSFGNFWSGGATPATQETWGGVKARYRPEGTAKQDK